GRVLGGHLVQPSVQSSSSDTQQCQSSRGHCRMLCFHMERRVGTCSNGRQRCCK
uniref:Beta-defensin-like domain-containing protein n=1 Tax=Sphenodon punctatus TaxID=8508 RepID=A0A8D0HIA8_SPHPU